MLDFLDESNPSNKEELPLLRRVEELDNKLAAHYQDKLKIEPFLTRALVSFQANKSKPGYRWYKFKEAFSSSLVQSILDSYGVVSGRILDPFAGSGTTLFTASASGLDADGIELLPIGQQIIKARWILEREFTDQDFTALRTWIRERPWIHTESRFSLPELRITRGAYPEETVDAIERYLGALEQESKNVAIILKFALLCILESISFTRKDGQYLRWDYRSERRQGEKPFDKGNIRNFDDAITEKMQEILNDSQCVTELPGFTLDKNKHGRISVFSNSCLEIMKSFPENLYDTIFTSPPYCNRYDYTRTYALELALLGIGEDKISELRQNMLSCTVENRRKDLLKINPEFRTAVQITDNEELLQAIITYLEDQKARKALNNNGIPRMVSGYFYEMACVIYECYRVLKPGALMFMVNDNVRYAGASISVDLILSHIAEMVGFSVQEILVLPNGKGNSSQQMGRHGRDPLRKCIYVWRKG